jgi:holliday junction resolvase YEN1
MSNDVDALMFGSRVTVMNFSKENSSGSKAATHVTCYRAQEKDGLLVNVSLSRAGMILFAMLSGGDYLPSGIPKCGGKLAAQIAKAGFGNDLLEILDLDNAKIESNLSDWRDRLQYELDENESGYFQRKHKAVRIPETFPDRTILSYYANPVVSTTEEIVLLQERLASAWDHEIDALQIRMFAADTFDWKYRSGAKKIIRQLAEPLVSYRLRLAKPILAQQTDSSFTPNREASVLQRVYRSRTHYSTDGISQLQFEIIPVDVVGLNLGAEELNPTSQQEATDTEDEGDLGSVSNKAVRKQPISKQRPRYNPHNPEKLWVFQTVAEIGVPDIVEKWRQDQIEKASALKKSVSKSSTTKRRKPIDPSMKPGSILRYATVIKPRSNITSA